MINNKKKQRGEIILVILLVMAVGLTIGLSVAGRSLTDVRLSTQIDESNRAFSAAEAGIEKILMQGLASAPPTSSGTTEGGTSYNVSTSSLGSGSNLFSLPTVIEDGGSAIVWLVPYGSETRTYTRPTIDVCWKREDSLIPEPAMEVSVFFKKGSEYKVMRGAYDPNNSRRSFNGFENTSSASICTDSGYNYHKQINFNSLASQVGGINLSSDILISLRLRPVYAKTKIAVAPAAGGSLPEQGKNIASTGQTASGVTRRWNVVQTYPSFNIFDYAIWTDEELMR